MPDERRLGAIDTPVANNPRLVDQRIVRCRCACIAPVAIQRLVDAHARRAQRIEQLGGRTQHQFRDDHLRLGGFDFCRDIGVFLLLRVIAEARHISALQRLGGTQGGCLGGVHLRGDLPDHLLHLRILADAARVAVAENTFAVTHLLRDITLDGSADAGQHRQQHQLIKRRLILEALFKGNHMVRRQWHVVVHRRAAAGGALSETVPVVAVTHASVPGIDHGNHVGAIVGTLGVNVDPVGEDAAGAVELGAVEHKTIALCTDLGDHITDFHRTDFGPAIADQIPGDKACKPCVTVRARWRIQAVFDKSKMRPQSLRDVRVGLGQLYQQLKKLADRGTGTAIFGRYPYSAETGFLQPFNRFIGQGTGFFTFNVARADLTEDRSEAVGQGFVIGAQREWVRAGWLSHAVLLSAKRSARVPG
ncbi:hypothetical protein ALO95_05583 [Pseudomonas syringae pv. antirrhini]|nr:hypothetical protein ALO95_05583 [Pseudomonas syringae pv. antirrhini]